MAGIIYYYEPERRALGYSLAPLSIMAMILGEITHDWGRMPYMVITGETGIPAELFVNKLFVLDLPSIAMGLIPIIVITTGFLILLYLYLAKGFLQ